jgi:hypothetical protein
MPQSREPPFGKAGTYKQLTTLRVGSFFHHLPAIARDYIHVWELDELLVVEEDMIPQRLLHQIGDQIRSLIHYSNKARVARLRNSGAVPLESSIMKSSPPADDDAQPSPPKRRRRESNLPSPSALPSSLKASELKDTSINKLAAIEHCLWLLQQEGAPLSGVELIASAKIFMRHAIDSDIY